MKPADIVTVKLTVTYGLGALDALCLPRCPPNPWKETLSMRGTSLRHVRGNKKKGTFDPAPSGSVMKEVERSDNLLSRSDSADSVETA